MREVPPSRSLFQGITVFLLVAICLLLSACSEGFGSNRRTLIIWSPYADADVQILIKNYEAVNPNVEVIHSTQRLTNYFSFLEERISQGLGPDLAIVPDRELPSLIRQGLIEDLDEYSINLANLYSKSLISVRGANRHLYGVPFGFQTLALCYNRNQSTDPPTTLTAVLDQASRGKGSAIEPGFLNSAWGIGAMNGVLFNSLDQFTLREEALSRWLSWLKQAQQTPNVFIDNRRSVLFDLFATEKVAYFPCWTYELSALGEKLGDRLDVGLLPGYLNSAAPVLETDSLVLNRYTTTAQKQLSMEFAEFVTRREQQLAFQAAQTAIVVPINPRVLIDRRLLPIRRSLIEQVQNSISIPIAQSQYQVNRLVYYADAIYTQVMQGDQSPVGGARQFLNQINHVDESEDIEANNMPKPVTDEADNEAVQSDIAPQADYLLQLFQIQFQIFRRPIIWLQLFISTVVVLLTWLIARRLNLLISNFSEHFTE